MTSTVDRRRLALRAAAMAYVRAWDAFQLDDSEDKESMVALMEHRLYRLAGLDEPEAKDGDA